MSSAMQLLVIHEFCGKASSRQGAEHKKSINLKGKKKEKSLGILCK